MAGDGTDQDTLTEGRPPSNEAKYGDPPDEAPENLLTMDPRKAALTAYRLWKDQPQEPIQRRRAEWQVNAWRREGRTNVYVQKTQDQGRWTAWSPPWSVPPIPVLNKADRLCRRLAAKTFADDPVPEGVPSSGDDEDVESSEFSVRVLLDIQGEGQLDELRKARRAFDRASTYGSGFIRYYLDQRGGGRKPVRIMAKPGALSADAPFSDPNGQMLPGELVARYVSENGALQDTPQGAATRWMPALKSEILLGTQVRFLPHDAEDIWDADGVVIATMPTWGELEKLWPDEMAAITPEDKDAILAFKPEQAKDILGLESGNKQENAKRDEDKRVAVFTVYYRSGSGYDDGCYFVGLGDRVMLHREEWVGDLEGERLDLDIPLTQYTQFDSGRREPYGLGMMTLLGGAHELRASQIGHLLTYEDQFLNRKTFIPTNSILQPKSYQLMQGTTIAINPGGEPKFEEVPSMSSIPTDVFAIITAEMDDHSGLQQTGQGTEVPSVTSGVQAKTIVNEVRAGLSDVQQNVERAYLRGCRIQLQQVKVGYTVPQQISWTGEDGAYKQKWWTGSDLKGTKDVRLKRGSLSMMTPEQKVNMAFGFAAQGLYASNPEQLYDTVSGAVGPTVGLQDDPIRSRIKRQLASWSNGPPEGWMPPQPVMPMVNNSGFEAPNPLPVPQMAVPPQQAFPVGQQQAMQAPDPHLAAIFEVLPADELPTTAPVRLAELTKFMASTRYTRWPPEWRTGVDQEFQHMKVCSGVLTIPEQQAQMAQQQAEQLAQQAAAANAAQNGEKDIEFGRDPTGRLQRARVVSRSAPVAASPQPTGA